MTDIWRSFVAQRCLWEMNSSVAFTSPSVYQVRNEHNLLRDFEQEIPGYLKNEHIRISLEQLQLKTGRSTSTVCENLFLCYQSLVAAGVIPEKELHLVEAWTKDLSSLG